MFHRLLNSGIRLQVGEHFLSGGNGIFTIFNFFIPSLQTARSACVLAPRRFPRLMSAALFSRISSPLIQSIYISSLDNAEVHMQGGRCSRMLLCAKRILTALGSSITAQYILLDWRSLSRILLMAVGLQASLSGIAFESHNSSLPSWLNIV